MKAIVRIAIGVFVVVAVSIGAAERDPGAVESERLLRSSNTVEKGRGAALADQACSAGSGDACSVLGDAYWNGAGVKRDLDKAFSLFLKSCDLGWAHGCALTGLAYERGEGVRTDHDAGMRYAQKACSMGDGGGCSYVGLYYKLGKVVPKDMKRAVALFEQSCRAGIGRGCGNLGEAYENGEAGAVDVPLALELYDLACDFGASEGCERAERLARRNNFARFPSRANLPKGFQIINAFPEEIHELHSFYVSRGDNIEARDAIVEVLKKRLPQLSMLSDNAPLSTDTAYVTFSLRGKLYIGELAKAEQGEKRVLFTERYSSGLPVSLARDFANEVVKFFKEQPNRGVLPIRFRVDAENARPALGAAPSGSTPEVAASKPAPGPLTDKTALGVIDWISKNTKVNVASIEKDLAEDAAVWNYYIAIGGELTNDKKPVLLFVWENELFITPISAEQAARWQFKPSSTFYATQGKLATVAPRDARAKISRLKVEGPMRLGAPVRGTLTVSSLGSLPATASLRITMKLKGQTNTFYRPLKDLKKQNGVVSFETSALEADDDATAKPAAIFTDFLEDTPGRGTTPPAISNRLMQIVSLEAGNAASTPIAPAPPSVSEPRTSPSSAQSAVQATMAFIRTLATATEAYATDHNEYPRTNSIVGLRPFLEPTYVRKMPVLDAWQRPFDYYVSADARSYRFVSGGANRTLDESWSFTQAPKVVKDENKDDRQDLVYENGQFLRYPAPHEPTPQELAAMEEGLKALPPDERTKRNMTALGISVEAWATDHDSKYPEARSVADLDILLRPLYLRTTPDKDAWGTTFRYDVSRDGRTYRIVSAGPNRKFEPDVAGSDDLVYQNLEFVKPGRAKKPVIWR